MPDSTPDTPDSSTTVNTGGGDAVVNEAPAASEDKSEGKEDFSDKE